MNRTKDQIDSFINEKLVEVMRSDKYIKGVYTNNQTYQWQNEKYRTFIEIAVSRTELKGDQS